ncbi:NB-ARC domain-containing protein [Streptosporangium sp. NPDC020145]|uniref:NB-ARC domain-containing protein n=1 Tax=Streptosporangium sp. NPDC020145 TaxID=3154694 RepID=UPI00341BD3E3
MVIESDDERSGAGGTRNELSGQVAGNVVQAGVIQHLTFAAQEPPVAEIPRQLPPEPRDFVNRVRELDELDRLLDEGGDGSAPLVAVVNGLGGVGKSALSRRWAHRVRERFTDGQLYASLGDLRHGGGVAVSDVLGGFLRALGVREAGIPADPSERAALFRSRTADLRLLILLDDVEHAAQVTPVLPASASGVVVVTSHSRLGELVVTGAVPVPLAPLDEEQGVRLLAGVLGEERVHAEPEAAGELARLCGGLPVALRVAAARLAQRRGRPIARLVTELTDERRRLERLAVGGKTIVEAVFETACRALPPGAGRLYRLLGAVPVADLSVQAVQVVAGTGERETEESLELLLEANLLEETAQERYRFHDLVRLHAARLAEREEAPGEREAALGRMARWYRACAMAADRTVTRSRLRLAPVPEPVEPEVTFSSARQALDWLDGERGNMLAVLRLAERAGWDDVVWQTVEALWVLHHSRKHYADWIEAGRLGTLAAGRLGNRAAEARMRNQTARAFVELGELGPADEELRLARSLAVESGDRRLEAAVLESLGQVELARGAFDAAIGHFTEALVVNEALGRTRGAGLQSYHLGLTHTAAGRPREAFEAFERARGLIGAEDETSQAKIDIELGLVHRMLGRPQEIVGRVTEAARTMRARGVPLKEARAWEILAGLTADLGDERGSEEHLRRAIAVYLDLGKTAKADELGGRLPPPAPEDS